MANHVQNLRDHLKNHLAHLRAEEERRRKMIAERIAAHHPLPDRPPPGERPAP